MSVEARTRTSESEITALSPTLKPVNVCPISFAQETTKKCFLDHRDLQNAFNYYLSLNLMIILTIIVINFEAIARSVGFRSFVSEVIALAILWSVSKDILRLGFGQFSCSLTVDRNLEVDGLELMRLQ